MKASTLKLKLNPYFKNLSSSHVNYTLAKDKLTQEIFGKSFMNPKTKAAYEAYGLIVLPEEKKKKLWEAIGDAFKELDKNDDKRVELDELKAYLKENNVVVENVEKVFKQADKNNNGWISVMEWFIIC